MPRKSSKSVETEPVVDIAADVEAVNAEPLADVVVEVVPDAPEVEIPPQLSKFTGDALADALAAYADALARGLSETNAQTTGVIAGKEWHKRHE